MILSWLARFFRSFGREPFVHWYFAGLTLGSAAMGLGDVVRGLPVGQVFLLSTLAVLAGWLLARFRRLAIILAPFFILSGWIAALIMQANLGPSLLAWLNAASAVLREAIRWRETGQPDLEPLILAGKEITTLLYQVQESLSAWFSAWEHGSPSYDLLAVGLIWSCAFWVLGMWTGWSFRRWRRPMVSLLPAGLLVVGSLNYASGDARYLLPFTGFLIGWMAILNYKEARNHWLTDNIDYAEDISLDFSLATSAIIILLLLVGFFAASIPVISVRAAVEWAQNVFNPNPDKEDTVAKSFGLQRESPPTYFQLLSAGELPRKHLIGSGPDLSKRVVMSVQVMQTGASAQPEIDTASRRYYWRSLTYDEYTGLGWQSSQTKESGLTDGSIIHPQEFPTQLLVEQQIRLIEEIGPSIYAAGELLTVNMPFTVAWRPVSSSSVDPAARLDLFGASTGEKTYRALSAISGADLNALRNAGDHYPDWVIQRYLALPPGIPMRVLELASELTRGAPTPLDRIRIIESYLRKIPYTLDLPAPPVDRDIVDYFLFDLKKGYCDYYATAMVVMARAIGIPARLAMGYASGSYDSANQRYLVTEADAHSWPEIYFPGYGWIEFEPTGGLPEVQRPSSSSFQPPSTMPPDLLQDFQRPVAQRLIHSWLIWVAGFGLLVLIGILIYNSIRYRRLSPGDSIIITYQRFHRQARPLTEPLPTGHTPLELISRIEQWFTARPDLVRYFPGLQRISILAHRLTDLYMRVIYSPRMPGKEGQKEVRKLWNMLRLPLQISVLFGKLSPFKGDWLERSNDGPPPGSGVVQ
jgi:transglutaminase-like putative cysteine protease